MIDDDERHAPDTVAANDNAAAEERIDKVVLTLARLLGRQMVCEAFERRSAANDNQPPDRYRD